MEQKLLTIFEKYGLGDGEITDAGLNKRENLLTVTVRCGHCLLYTSDAADEL